ncbi:mitochondrial sodium/calcium exchanger protein-like isoform X1 [Asterias amurensis]|uniref:mitochondrial sodium/calcium exchanger protein-like isoform X1 n=2 Tax=Asterias amurensis TaxID=7602 RepID=UPI003AB657C3
MDKSSALIFLTQLTVLLSFRANVHGSPVYSFVNSDGGAGDNSTLHGVGNTSAVHLQLIQCTDYHGLNASLQCEFIRATNDCRIDDGFINYLEFSHCAFPHQLLPLALFILFVWLIFLFVSLGITAEDFFCPALTAISKSMKLSQNIVGVTFLAFGNGAPDIFSAVAAITNAKDGDAGLAIGALFGAGVFVTTVVTGSVSIARPFELAQRPFLRDAIFYVGAAFWTFYILYTGKIWTAEAVGFILLYVGYVLVVLIGRKVYQTRLKPKEVRLRPTVSIGTNQDFSENEGYSSSPETDGFGYGAIWQYVGDRDKPQDTTKVPHHPTGISEALLDTEQVVCASLLGEQNTAIAGQNGLPDFTRQYRPSDESSGNQPLLDGDNDEKSETGCAGKCLVGFWDEVKCLLRGINPIDVEDWKDKSVVGKIYEIFKSPLQLLLQLTVPIVDHTEDKHGWNRLLNCLQLIIDPLFCLLVTKNISRVLIGNFYLWQLLLGVGFILALIVFLTSKADRQPIYHCVFAYVGFVVSVFWIYSTANEIVNLLQMYGSVFHLSNAVLGLTLLAWGNSIGDLVSDVTVAKQGYPRMAVAACFGGPLFNMLLGIGISCTIACIKNGGTFHLSTNTLQFVLFGGLAASLFFSLFFMVATRFHANRVYGICLYVLYFVFLAVAILTETRVIKW